MSEHHQIVSDARGEPLPSSAGVRLRIQLSGCPSGRWSRALRVNLSNELVGHAAVGHMRLNDLVQGDQIVLDGVEAREAPTLAGSLQRAVEATNRAEIGQQNPTARAEQEEADAVAHQITLGHGPS